MINTIDSLFTGKPEKADEILNIVAPWDEEVLEDEEILISEPPYRETFRLDGKQWFKLTGAQVMWWEMEFRFETDDDIDLAVSKLLDAETLLSGEILKKERIIASCDEMIQERERRRNWINMRITPDLNSYILDRIANNMKGKTVKTHFGDISVANIPVKIEQLVSDEEIIEFAQTDETLQKCLTKKSTISIERKLINKHFDEFPEGYFIKHPVVENGKFKITPAKSPKKKDAPSDGEDEII